jgi:hypothetical protein
MDTKKALRISLEMSDISQVPKPLLQRISSTTLESI